MQTSPSTHAPLQGSHAPLTHVPPGHGALLLVTLHVLLLHVCVVHGLSSLHVVDSNVAQVLQAPPLH